MLLSGAHPCAADLPRPQTSSQHVSPYRAPRWARAGVHRGTGSRPGGAGAPGRLTEEKQEPAVTVVTSDLMGAGKSRKRGPGLQRSDNGAERLSQGGKRGGGPGTHCCTGPGAISRDPFSPTFMFQALQSPPRNQQSPDLLGPGVTKCHT